jgi:hypothetical protein
LVAAIKLVKEIIKLYKTGQDIEAERKCGEQVGNRRKFAFELVPVIAARIKTLFNKEENLEEMVFKKSAASERFTLLKTPNWA